MVRLEIDDRSPVYSTQANYLPMDIVTTTLTVHLPSVQSKKGLQRNDVFALLTGEGIDEGPSRFTGLTAQRLCKLIFFSHGHAD